MTSPPERIQLIPHRFNRVDCFIGKCKDAGSIFRAQVNYCPAQAFGKSVWVR